MTINFLLTSAQHRLDRVREKQIVRVNRLPFNCRVYHCSFKKTKFEKWRYISSIKLMEETDVSVQLYSFLEVMAVRYDEKPDNDEQRCDIRDIMTRRNVLCL